MSIQLYQIYRDNAIDGLIQMSAADLNMFAISVKTPVQINTISNIDNIGVLEISVPSLGLLLRIDANNEVLINGDNRQNDSATALIELLSVVFFDEGGGSSATPNLQQVLNQGNTAALQTVRLTQVDDYAEITANPAPVVVLQVSNRKTEVDPQKILFTDTDTAIKTVLASDQNLTEETNLLLPQGVNGYLETVSKRVVSNITLAAAYYEVLYPGIFSVDTATPNKISIDCLSNVLKGTVLFIVNQDNLNPVEFNAINGIVKTTKTNISPLEMAIVVISNDQEVYIK